MRQEKNASGITCEETKLDQALAEIIDKEKLADENSSEAKMIEHFIRISFLYMGNNNKKNSDWLIDLKWCSSWKLVVHSKRALQ